MESTDSHDAQVQVPGQLPQAGSALPSNPVTVNASPVNVSSDSASSAPPIEGNNPAPFPAGIAKPGVFAPGTIVGSSYEVIELLGRGAMGMVYRVKHVTLPAEYALKILTDDKQDEVSVIRFQNEAQAIAKLNHPNIVAIYNFGLHDGSLPFYVMDLLAGEDLLDKIAYSGPMAPEMALPLFIEACAGLSFAHRKGILHRDVKPANLLILDRPDVQGARVKVVDFGIVKFAEELKPDSQKLTAMGIVCGSPSYMSPEQAMGQKVDPRSDIYSLGCSLFETLTGKVPFRGRSASDTMMMHVSAPSPSLASKNPEAKFSDDLEILVARMMAKERMYRYQTMDSVAQDLKNLLEGKPLASTPFVQSNFGVVQGKAEGAFESSLTQGNIGRVTDKLANRQDESLFDGRFTGDDGRFTGEQDASGEYESEEDEDDRSEDEEADGNGDRSSVAKVLFLALLFLGIVGVASYFIVSSMYLSSSQSKKTVSASTSVLSPPVELKLESNDLNSELHLDEVDSDLDAGAELITLPSARYFSKDITESGRKLVQFEFPAKSCKRPLAWIGTSVHDKTNAEGIVRFPKGSKIYLVASPNATKQPKFFEKFRSGDIEHVYLFPPFASDRLAELSMSIPGIKLLCLAGCPGLTSKIIPALDRLTSLETLMVGKTTMDGADWAKSSIWKRLATVVVSECKNVHPILKKLSGSTKLISLDVSHNELDSNDYRLISNLPNLQNLVLNKNKITTEDLQLLSRLPHLSTLAIVDTHLTPGSLAKAIEQFPSLETLLVDRGHFPKQDLTYLKKRLPRLKVVFFIPRPNMFADF